MINCEENEKMRDIFVKFAKKFGININDLSFLYNGNKVIEELTLKDMIKGREKGDNVITIFVNDINGMNQKEKIKEYKEIISLKRKENELVKVDNKINNYIIAEFEINEEDINKKTRIINSFEA